MTKVPFLSGMVSVALLVLVPVARLTKAETRDGATYGCVRTKTGVTDVSPTRGLSDVGLLRTVEGIRSPTTVG